MEIYGFSSTKQVSQYASTKSDSSVRPQSTTSETAFSEDDSLDLSPEAQRLLAVAEGGGGRPGVDNPPD